MSTSSHRVDGRPVHRWGSDEEQPTPIKAVEMALRSLAVTAHAMAWAVDRLSEGLEFCAET